jgi:hypothetical protein
MAKQRINPDEIDESFIIAAVKKDKSSVPNNPERLLTPSSSKTAGQPEDVNEKTAQTAVIPEQSKEEGKRKRKSQDYEKIGRAHV